ncbi:MAG: small multi-drug export protein [Oscillospiraceae bacterium]|jgi:uncharacterized membrane protein|nr:small multi-drug export protein [Oscillospiraceae bacterium]
MTEGLAKTLTEFFTNAFSGTIFENIMEEITVLIISMMPVLELRGGMIAAKLMGVELVPALVICFIGNIIPIPFILMFIKRIFAFMKNHGILVNFIQRLERRADEKGSQVKNYKYEKIGLLAFVAIPLPGTGGWTGSLVASMLNMKIKDSFPIVVAGILIAEVIMAFFSYGLLGALGVGS